MLSVQQHISSLWRLLVGKHQHADRVESAKERSMKKMSKKRLVLDRETVKALSSSVLQEANGGEIRTGGICTITGSTYLACGCCSSSLFTTQG
jgi:hypothetical protein